jgi:peptide/nickel transport system ATP-binding protein
VGFVLKGLSIHLDGRPLVSDVSLSITRGEVVALVGASGSGKSLIASALSGSLPGNMDVSGSLTIEGRATSLAGRHRPEVSTVRQDSLTALHPLVRIDRQLTPVLLGSGMVTTRPAASTSARMMLEEVGLEDPRRILQSYPMELSGGQRQRVCIVQALACGAPFLVADEPTTALDTVSQQRVLTVLGRTASAGAGVLLITHDVLAAASLCSRAIVIDQGTVVDQGSFEHLAGTSSHPYARALVGPAPRAIGRPDTAAA